MIDSSDVNEACCLVADEMKIFYNVNQDVF